MAVQSTAALKFVIQANTIAAKQLYHIIVKMFLMSFSEFINGMASIDQSKLSVAGYNSSQTLNVGKYRNVKVRVNKLSEPAAGLSEGEKKGGVLPIT